MRLTPSIPTRRALLIGGLAGAGTLVASPALAETADAAASLAFESPADGAALTGPQLELRVRADGATVTAVVVHVADDATAYPDASLPLDAQGDGTFTTTWEVPSDWFDGRTKQLQATAYADGDTLNSAITVVFGSTPVEPDGLVDDFEGYDLDEDVAAAYATDGATLSLSRLHHSTGEVGLTVDYETLPDDPAWVVKDLAADWSGFSELSLWLRGDGSDSSLTIDVQAGGTWYRRWIPAGARSGRTVEIPFSRLRTIGKDGRRGSGRLRDADRTRIQAVRLGVWGEGTGRIYLDDIRAS